MEYQVNRRITRCDGLIMYGRTDEAIGILWQVQGRVKQMEEELQAQFDQLLKDIELEDVYVADEVKLTDNWQRQQRAKLPPMKPIRGKRVRAIDVVCPSCNAQPGQQCHRMTKRGTGGVPIPGEYVNHNHNPRIKRAKGL